METLLEPMDETSGRALVEQHGLPATYTDDLLATLNNVTNRLAGYKYIAERDSTHPQGGDS